ncbi:class I SAM-dependent methyltransferase [Gammaproteobacteria bacterium]|nr:class I SAM-dependent methyltransferase [Gammaproteobacteria bacterium]|tara:strand:- start:190 stop:792 length:603 start_codon:yes stop_codon:yes gene_type:complete
MNSQLPYSEACEKNKSSILKIFQKYIKNQKTLLEIGSGSGQHAAFFAERFPNLVWQSSDVTETLYSLNLRLVESRLKNLPEALPVNVDNLLWSEDKYDLIFTANSLHIMSESSVRNFFLGLPKVLEDFGLVLIYGPFKYKGQFTTESNAEFDNWLKARDLRSGIRDFESVNFLAKEARLELIEDASMPANNQLLVYSKTN